MDAHLCTHIIYAFGYMKKGKISSLEANDETVDGKTGLYERTMALKKVNPDLKVLLAIGTSLTHTVCLHHGRISLSSSFLTMQCDNNCCLMR